MKQCAIWLLRLTVLSVAVGLLVGFAHFSGLNKYRISHLQNMPQTYRLVLHPSRSNNTADKASVCRATMQDFSVRLTSHGSSQLQQKKVGNTMPQDALLFWKSWRLMRQVVYFSAQVKPHASIKINRDKSIDVFDLRSQTLDLYGLSWQDEVKSGVGLFRSKHCHGWFTLQALGV